MGFLWEPSLDLNLNLHCLNSSRAKLQFLEKKPIQFKQSVSENDLKIPNIISPQYHTPQLLDLLLQFLIVRGIENVEVAQSMF